MAKDTKAMVTLVQCYKWKQGGGMEVGGDTRAYYLPNANFFQTCKALEDAEFKLMNVSVEQHLDEQYPDSG